MTSRTEEARQVLRTNDRGGYTVPTARLYPFQWNWDSAFVAMGFATFDEPRAWDELDHLAKGQWEDGLIPQIIFHAPSDDYFPGPDVWQIERTPPTTGITQPPVIATAARRIWQRSATPKAATDRLKTLYPALLAYHRWFATARDPQSTGLVTTLHPWETGMDNSPAWDIPMARVPTTTETTIRRRDTSHIDPAMRPRAEDYQRFIHLVDTFRHAGWNPARMMAASPLRVADIATNAILLRAERDLLAIAEALGTPAEQAEIAARITLMQAAISELWNPEHGLFTSRDLIDGSPLAPATSAGFLPLFAGAATPQQAAAMRETLHRWAKAGHLVPSTDPHSEKFEPLRYWRGPIWAVVNWMIAEGFADMGDAHSASLIRHHTSDLIAQAGFAEYFDPQTGTGAGGASFSWTAAIWLLLEEAK